jgi:hypothetical protein
MTAPEDHFFEMMKTKSPPERTDLLLGLYKDLPKKQQEEFAQAVLGPPSDGTRDLIWVIIVGAFALVLLCSAAVLFWAAFAETKAGATYFGKIETVVTVFTSVLAFLSGLLAPSPVKK